MLKKWFKRKEPLQVKQLSPEEQAYLDGKHPYLLPEQIPKYPPFKEGLPSVSIAQMLSTQAELIERIRTIIGFNESEHQKYLIPVIQKYASFVHLLPASERHHHRGAGGLFRHGLQSGFFAVQFSEGRIMSRHGSLEHRLNAEPKWRLAAFICGIGHDIGKPVTDLVVSNASGDKKWVPLTNTSLYDWLMKNDISHYFIHWRANRHGNHEALASTVLGKILPDEVNEFLTEGDNAEIAESIHTALTGNTAQTTLATIMIKADQTSVTQDLIENKVDEQSVNWGVPVHKHISDIIRGFIDRATWKVNRPSGQKAECPIWYTNIGLFIDLEQFITDIHREVAELGIAGIPKRASAIAEILIDYNIAEPFVLQTDDKPIRHHFWRVQLDFSKYNEINGAIQSILKDEVRPIKNLLKISSPSTFFDKEIIAPSVIAEVKSIHQDKYPVPETKEQMKEHIKSGGANKIIRNPIKVEEEVIETNQPKEEIIKEPCFPLNAPVSSVQLSMIEKNAPRIRTSNQEEKPIPVLIGEKDKEKLDLIVNNKNQIKIQNIKHNILNIAKLSELSKCNELESEYPNGFSLIQAILKNTNTREEAEQYFVFQNNQVFVKLPQTIETLKANKVLEDTSKLSVSIGELIDNNNTLNRIENKIHYRALRPKIALYIKQQINLKSISQEKTIDAKKSQSTEKSKNDEIDDANIKNLQDTLNITVPERLSDKEKKTIDSNKKSFRHSDSLSVVSDAEKKANSYKLQNAQDGLLMKSEITYDMAIKKLFAEVRTEKGQWISDLSKDHETGCKTLPISVLNKINSQFEHLSINKLRVYLSRPNTGTRIKNKIIYFEEM